MTNSRNESRLDDRVPADERADRIVAAALAVFREAGFASTRLNAIARRAGVSMPTLLLYFPSKDELFREVVRSTVIAAVRSVEGDTVATGSTTADAVRAIAHRYWSTMGQSEMIAIARLALSELPRFPELATLHAIEGLERFVCLLERVIEAGVARGEVKPTDVRASARIIQATLAVHALWFAHPEIYGAITGADREKAATATIDTLLRTLIG